MNCIKLCLIGLTFFFITSINAQETDRTNDRSAIKISTTINDAGDIGGVLGMESFFNDHFFTSYSVGLRQSSVYKKDLTVNWEIGYRFRFDNGYQPDISLGYGFMYGNPKKDDIKNDSYTDDLEMASLFSLKLGIINWEFKKVKNPNLYIYGNIILRGEFPEFPESTANTFTQIFEAGVGIPF